jgi:hypothetical protein
MMTNTLLLRGLIHPTLAQGERPGNQIVLGETQLSQCSSYCARVRTVPSEFEHVGGVVDQNGAEDINQTFVKAEFWYVWRGVETEGNTAEFANHG